jgi:hypothetical protein
MVPAQSPVPLAGALMVLVEPAAARSRQIDGEVTLILGDARKDKQTNECDGSGGAPTKLHYTAVP